MENNLPQQSSDKENKITPAKFFEITLKKYESNVTDLLQSHGVSPKEFMVIAVNAVKKNPKLLECERSSLFGAFLTAAELGLLPNTPAQHSYIIPYKGRGGVIEAQFQIGYQGHLELMHRNPNVIDIETEIVYEKDEFEVIKGEDKKIIHKPHRGSDRGKRIAVYGIAYLKNAVKPKFVVLYDYEIEKFKKISQTSAFDSSPWKNEDKDPMGWMWRKTVIKQLAKEIPKTKAIEKAIHVDNVVETGGKTVVTEEGNVEVLENETYMIEQKNEAAQESSENRSKSAMDNLTSTLKKDKKE